MPIVAAAILKAPREGFVKTRLARAIGVAKATLVYRKLVEHQIAQIPAHWRIQIHYAPFDALTEMRKWLGPDYSYLAQADGNLGERLQGAMDNHFAKRDGMPLVFVGADCPYLTSSYFVQIERELVETDAVLVPAIDGGYCLLAMRRSIDRIFDEIAWGTDRVAAQTRERLLEQKISWKELPALEDVDDEASWLRAKHLFPESVL